MNPSSKSDQKSPKRPPARTPEARERQLAGLAMDLAEKQLREGKASSQVITHFLQIASTKEEVKQDILREKRELIKAQTDSLKAAKRVEELYMNALDAMKTYTGNRRKEEDDNYDG